MFLSQWLCALVSYVTVLYTDYALNKRIHYTVSTFIFQFTLTAY